MTEASTVTNSQNQNQFTNNSDQNAESLESDGNYANDGCDHGCVLEVDGNYANNTDHVLLSKSTNFLAHFLLRDDTDEDVGRVFTDQAPESVDPKTTENMAASKERLELEDALLGNHIEGNIGNDESKCVKGWGLHVLRRVVAATALRQGQDNEGSDNATKDCLVSERSLCDLP